MTDQPHIGEKDGNDTSPYSGRRSDSYTNLFGDAPVGSIRDCLPILLAGPLILLVVSVLVAIAFGIILVLP